MDCINEPESGPLRCRGPHRAVSSAVVHYALVNAASRVVVTASGDVVGPADRASGEEADATRRAFEERGCDITWHETPAGAMRDVATASSSGDLVVLVGAQGMDEGARLLRGAVAGAEAPALRRD